MTDHPPPQTTPEPKTVTLSSRAKITLSGDSVFPYSVRFPLADFSRVKLSAVLAYCETFADVDLVRSLSSQSPASASEGITASVSSPRR